MSKETHQWYEMVAEEFSRIEELKAEAIERGEIIKNITAMWVDEEITDEQYRELIDNL